MLRRLFLALAARTDEAATTMSAETRKPVAEARGEMQAAVE
jgi:acyl-CoA reductase-like NAD-dependent aldehyde dehydrogenase